MTFIDIVLGIFLLYGFVKGIWNGFFLELASFVSLLIGVILAVKFSYVMQSILSDHLNWNLKTVQIVAFTLTFILVVVGISVLAKVFTKIASFAGLGIFNKFFGGVFGLLKMVLILSIIFNLFEKINSNHTFAKKETLENSKFYYPILKVSGFIYPSMGNWPEELKNNS
jgi:membrane protein required for colicin V production